MISSVSPQLAILVGVLTAGGVHGLRSALRPVLTASTGGLLNPLQSLGEDTAAVTLTGAALFFPLLALLLLVLLVVGAVDGRRLDRPAGDSPLPLDALPGGLLPQGRPC